VKREAQPNRRRNRRIWERKNLRKDDGEAPTSKRVSAEDEHQRSPIEAFPPWTETLIAQSDPSTEIQMTMLLSSLRYKMGLTGVRVDQFSDEYEEQKDEITSRRIEDRPLRVNLEAADDRDEALESRNSRVKIEQFVQLRIEEVLNRLADGIHKETETLPQDHPVLGLVIRDRPIVAIPSALRSLRRAHLAWVRSPDMISL
jgi:hypothetical protein